MIVHIITSLDIGGAETMLKKLVIERKKTGENDIVVCLKKNGVIAAELNSNGIEVYFLKINSIISLIYGVFKLNHILKEKKPSLVQTWLYHSDLIGGLISWLNRIPVVWNIRQTKFNSNANLFTIFVMRICAYLSYFIPQKIICAANASLITHKKFGYDKSKLFVIPNGFTISNTRPIQDVFQLKRRLGITDEEFVIGSIGRYHTDKDYLNLINAAQIVLTKYPNLKFVLIGKNLDKSNMQLKQYLEERNIEKKFLLLGQIENVDKYFYIFDIYCIHSKSEGFPNVLGEAMLMKLPCIVTDVGDCRYILKDNGIVVPPENSDLLAEGITHFVNMPVNQRKNLGIRSYLRIKDEFMLTDVVKKYNDLYNSIK
jgi:glycosyltransferase involved in cell wall biosynthesis